MKPHHALRVAAVLMAAAATGAQAQDPLVVRIGQVGPTSGPAAHLGKDNANGVRMAIADLNARPVRIAGQVLRFELVAEDDAADPKQGVQAAQKLCDQHVAGVVGHLAFDAQGEMKNPALTYSRFVDGKKTPLN